MSLWEINECIALSWNSSGDVLGVRVKKKNHKLEVQDTAFLNVEDEDFASAISDISEKLLLPSTHFIIAGGQFEGSVCFDLSLPNMPESDIKQAIQYELPRYLPIDPAEMVFGYRIIKTKSEDNKFPKLQIRVFAVMKKVWNELLTDFSSSGVKFDAIVHPFMVIDPLLEDEKEVYLPEVDRDFKYVSDGKSRQLIPTEREIDGDLEEIVLNFSEWPEKLNYETSVASEKLKKDGLEHFIPAMLQAAYALSSELREGKNHLISLPRELMPERFRRLRTSFIFLLLATFMLLAALVGRSWWENWSRLSSLQQENKRIQNRITVLKNSNQKLSLLEERIINELQEAEIGNDELTNCFHKLSIKMPKEMWLSHFSTRGSSIDMSIKAAAGKQSKVSPAINSTGIFKIKSLYTRKNSDGTENTYIHLDVLKPSGKQGGK